jgi:hypothetical protein
MVVAVLPSVLRLRQRSEDKWECGNVNGGRQKSLLRVSPFLLAPPKRTQASQAATGEPEKKKNQKRFFYQHNHHNRTTRSHIFGFQTEGEEDKTRHKICSVGFLFPPPHWIKSEWNGRSMNLIPCCWENRAGPGRRYVLGIPGGRAGREPQCRAGRNATAACLPITCHPQVLNG